MARALRPAGVEEPPLARAGAVLEFSLGGRLECGYLVRTPSRHEGFLVVDRRGQRRRVRRDKSVDLSRDTVPTYPAEAALRALQAIDARRHAAREAADLTTLWEIALDANRRTPWRLAELLELHNGSGATTAQRVGLLRALWHGDLFDRDGHAWRPRRPKAVRGVRTAQSQKAQRAHQVDALARWLRTVADGGPVTPRPTGAEHAVACLERSVLEGVEGEELGEVARLMQTAHLHGAGAAFDVLVRLGHWSVDENLELHRQGVPVGFCAAAAATASGLKPVAAFPGRRRWGGGVWAVSAAADGGADRAYRVRRTLTGAVVVDTHIALPALLVPPAGVLDCEAALRGTRVRLPDRDLPLLPDSVAEACRLTTARARPALTIRIRLGADLTPTNVRVRRSRVRPRGHLATADAPDRHAPLTALATALRRRRLQGGAWEGPWSPRLAAEGGGPRLVPEDGAGAIDTELALLTGQAIGWLCRAGDVAAIYQTRDAPHEEVDVDPEIPEAAAIRAYLIDGRTARSASTLTPGPHHGLGGDGPALGARPLDSYLDLVMQRQLLALAGVGSGHTTDELQRVVLESREAFEAAIRAERSGRRYWGLRLLEGRGAEARVDAVLIERRGPGYQLWLTAPPMAAFVVPASGRLLDVEPGQRLTVRIAQVSARRDLLRLDDPRLA